MKIIGLEEHMATPEVLDAWRRADPDANGFTAAWTQSIGPTLTDLGQGRLDAMDRAQLDVAVLSLTSPGVQDLDAAEAVTLQSATNDAIAAAVRRRPDRLRGFATLASPAPGAAADELERAIVDLDLDGAMLHTTTHGLFPDQAGLDPVFRIAHERRAPLYLHPSETLPAVTSAYYGGFDDWVSGALASGTPGWHYQTGIALLRLILAGTFDRYPDLQIIVGPWGEVILFYLDRIALLDSRSGLDRTIEEYFRRNVLVTPGGTERARSLGWAIDVVGAERILYASDYPYQSAATAADFLAAAPLADSQRELIAHGNWDRVSAGIRR